MALSDLPQAGASESLYQTIVEHSRDLIYIVGRDDIVRYVNPTAARMLGRAAKELIGLRRGDLFPKEVAERQKLSIDSVLETGNAVFVENSSGPPHVIRWHSTHIIPLFDADGRAYAVLGISRDITDRRKMEEEIQDAHTMLRTIIEGASIAISLYEESGACVLVNEATISLIGATGAEMRHQNFRELESWRKSGMLAMAEEVLETGAQRRDSFVLRTTFRKEVSAECFMARILVGGKRHLLLMATDTTERRRLEGEIMAISEREQGRIGRDLHDGLCQQLAGTAFSLKVLENELSGGPAAVQARQASSLVRDAMTMARELTRGLLPLSLQQNGLPDALEELCAALERMFNIPCRLTIQGALPDLEVDTAAHLYRIAQEAANNAIRHGMTKRLDMKLLRSGERLSLRVKDEGVGFSPDSKDRAGMGLGIMRHRAEVIGARLQIHSAQPGGTVVECSLTLRERQGAPGLSDDR